MNSSTETTVFKSSDEKFSFQLRQIRASTMIAIRCAEQHDLGRMMRDSNEIINMLNSMISEVSTARRVAINKHHQAGFTYRKMADEIGISYQRVAEIAKGTK
jgi:hypothetical protein